MKRANGFNRGINFYQIFTYFSVTLHCFCFLLLSLKMPHPLWIYVMSPGVVLLTLLLFLGLICSYSSPTDPISMLRFDLSMAENCQSMCISCLAFASANSKHCNTCKRCVNGFDHHCKWINNCIGIQNYKYFIALILSFECYFLYGVVIEILCIRDTDLWILGILMLDLFISSCIILSNGFLILFHIYLYCNKTTTYEIARKKWARTKVYSGTMQEECKEETRRYAMTKIGSSRLVEDSKSVLD